MLQQNQTNVLHRIQAHEPFAHQNLNNPNFNIRAACVKHWESCAKLAVNGKDQALRMIAIESHEAVALSVLKTAIALNDSFALVKCARHQNLAEQLYQHKNPLIRTACAKWHHLALELCKDENEYVRNACCQWNDIARTLINDSNTQIVCIVVSRFEDLANKSINHPDPLVRLHCALNWPSCAEPLTNDADIMVSNAAHKVLARNISYA